MYPNQHNLVPAFFGSHFRVADVIDGGSKTKTTYHTRAHSAAAMLTSFLPRARDITSPAPRHADAVNANRKTLL